MVVVVGGRVGGKAERLVGKRNLSCRKVENGIVPRCLVYCGVNTSCR